MQLFAPLTSLVVGHIGGPGAIPLVLAHQGGWDEILMVLVPVSLFAALLYVANRRASSMAARNDLAMQQTSDGTPPTADGGEQASAPPAPTVPTPRPTPRNDRGGPI